MYKVGLLPVNSVLSIFQRVLNGRGIRWSVIFGVAYILTLLLANGIFPVLAARFSKKVCSSVVLVGDAAETCKILEPKVGGAVFLLQPAEQVTESSVIFPYQLNLPSRNWILRSRFPVEQVDYDLGDFFSVENNSSSSGVGSNSLKSYRASFEGGCYQFAYLNLSDSIWSDRMKGVAVRRIGQFFLTGKSFFRLLNDELGPKRDCRTRAATLIELDGRSVWKIPLASIRKWTRMRVQYFFPDGLRQQLLSPQAVVLTSYR